MVLVFAGNYDEYLTFLKEWQLLPNTSHFKCVDNICDLKGISHGCPFILLGSWKWRRDAAFFFEIVNARNFIEMEIAD